MPLSENRVAPNDEIQKEKLITQYREKIKKDGKKLSDVLSKLYDEGKKFVLVGENHTQIDVVHKAVQASLPQLKTQGLTHLFLENGRDLQPIIDGLDTSMSDNNCILYLESNGIRGTFLSKENLNTMIVAKRLGFKVVFIDDPISVQNKYVEQRIPYKKRHFMDHEQRERLEELSKSEQNTRDKNMFDTLQNSIDDDQSKGLIIIGSTHVRKTKGEPTINNESWVRRLGSRMIEKYGDKVSSIRYLYSGSSMDDIYRSNKPAPKDIYPKLQDVLAEPTGVIVMKDEGLFAGDKRVVDSDFVLIPTIE